MSSIYYALLPFLAGTLILILGAILFRANPNLYRNRSISIMCVGLAIWLYSYAINYIFPDKPFLNLFLGRFSYFGVTLIPLMYLHFIVEFLNIKKSKYKIFVNIMSVVFIVVALFSNLIVKEMKTYFWGPYPVAGSLHPMYVLFVVSAFIYCLINLFLAGYGSRRKDFSAVDINRIKYVFWAFLLGNIGSIDFIQNYGFEFYPFGAINITLLVAIMTFAIVRHQLMDIEVIIKKTLVFTGILASVFGVLIMPTLIIQEYLFRGAGTAGKVLGLTISGIIIIFTMRRIEEFLINITDKYLFQKKYDYKELLKTFTTEVLTVLELDKLVGLTAEKLKEIMRIESCEVILLSDNKIKEGEGQAVVPLILKDRRIGSLVLGKKKSDESYTQDDMDILLPLARTLAIAISNAELFSELSKAQANAAQKEKMAGIGTLAAGMAHEIRNPITTIKIFTEYLDEKRNDPEFMAKFERLVPKEVDKINHMITSLLEFSKPAEGGEGEKVDINSALAEVAGILGNEMVLNDIVFDNKIVNIPQVLGNKKHIQEILFNIIENAIHAIGRRGRISVTAESGQSFVTVSIEDNGQGIPEENLKNIFEPFFTTKMNQKGVGLGLYVIKQLMARMDGDIEVESKVAKGTVFKLRFRSAS